MSSAFHDIPIGELLPQQPPFRFVDHLEDFQGNTARVSFVVSQEAMLVEDGCLSAAGLMEHMAQTCAARTGYHTVYILHKPVSIGFIGQIRGCRILRLPAVGERLESVVTVLDEVFGITRVTVEVNCGGKLIASAEMKMAVPDAS